MIVSYINSNEERVQDNAGFRTIPQYSPYVSMFGQFFLTLESTNEMLNQHQARERRVQIEQAEIWELRAYTLWQHGVEVDRTKENRR